MKMKMKTKAMPTTGVDKATRNFIIQSNRQVRGKAKLEHEDRKSAIIASWFSPQKYKGFKTNFK